MDRFDVIVLGGGPGGYVGAIRAAQLGKQVAVVESERVGGVCLNWGCIPSKAILSSAELYDEMRDAPSYGLSAEKVGFDYSQVIARSRKAADRLAKGVESLFKKNKITLVSGRGVLSSPQRVRVSSNGSSRELEASEIVVATGSTERSLPGLDIDGEVIMTSRQALVAQRFPSSFLVIGGGAVGLEFAYIYAAFGARVTIVEMEKQLLPGLDVEVAEELRRSFKRRKIAVLTETRFKELQRRDERGAALVVTGPKGEQTLEAEQVLVAVGRAPLSKDIGLEALGIRTERGFVQTDEQLRTSCSSVRAIGDVIGPPLLAHKASEEGIAAAEFQAGVRRAPVDYGAIPACVYCQPEVATVGLSEDQARARGGEIKVGKFPFTALGKAIATGHREGFVKLIVEARYGEILGCHIIGKGATDLISEIGLARSVEATSADIAHWVHPHPTLSEALMEAALAVEGGSINY